MGLILSILFTLIVVYLIKFYWNVRSYPAGPLPVPVFGNLLTLFWRRDKHPFVALHEMCSAFGKVSTFWLGCKPVVLIHDLELSKYALNKAEFCGRSETSLDLILSGNEFKSYALKDYSEEVLMLRKISIEAIRKLLSTNKLSLLVNEVVNETVNIIKLKESGKPFSTEKYVSPFIIRILSELTFGRKYSFGDEELKLIQHSFEKFHNEVTKLLLADFLPFSSIFLRSNAENRRHIKTLTDLYQKSFYECKSVHQNGDCVNFANSLLTARDKMLAEKKDNEKYLTDGNLIGALSALFTGGSDASCVASSWMLLFVAHYPQMQQNLRKEIKEIIGNRVATLEDKKSFNYLIAFINETLRFRTLAPFTVFHKTLCQLDIGNVTLPKNTLLLFDLYAFLNDTQHWKNPQNFIPERFLDSTTGLLVETRNVAFLPFGWGKRMCVGERIAHDLLFLELICLLQATDGYQFELPNGPQRNGLDYFTYPSFVTQPVPYKLILKPV